MRHAKPDQAVDSVDPPLDPSSETRASIDRAAREIATLLADPVKLVVFSSPARRAFQTAEALLEDRWIKEHSLTESPEVSLALEEGTFAHNSGYDRSMRWISTLHDMAGLAIRYAPPNHERGIILITHEPVIPEIPILNKRPRRRLNLDHIGLNHFSWINT